ncbi:MAG: hypothetical protein ACLP2F_10845 [Steroidobacteraceae bacterium]
MSFTAAEVSQLESLLALSDGGAQAALDFRSRFPGRSLTRCDALDMGTDEPFLRFAALDVYLVDGRDHCWRLTDDPAAATGVVLARRGRLP